MDLNVPLKQILFQVVFRVEMGSPQTQPVALGAGNCSGVLLGLILRSPPVRGAETDQEHPSPHPRALPTAGLGIYVPFPQLPQPWLGFIPLRVCQGIIFLSLCS